MTDTIDAVAVSDRIRGSYLRYLRTLLPLQDHAIDGALTRALADGAALVRGPILEATPPYQSGATLRDLIDEGVLHQDLLTLDKGGLPVDRELYRHQEEAVRRAVVGRNVVVATGTGSGKTESFLLPILDRLVRERDAGTLSTPGVRALLLYPMNALANDQLSRLRTALAPYPDITFGRYTGETEHQPDRAEDRFNAQFPGEPRLPNELLSREEMQARPPHLLLTNYAMLEYLLLRPSDTPFFDGDTAQHWRHIVLDEAHVYHGASGIEVAMLLRRLSDRVARGRELQSIATSATVGGTDAGPAVAEFASTLFGVPFQYDDQQRDVVWASRRSLTADKTWGPLPADAYAELRPLDDDERLARIRELATDAPDGDLFDVLATERRIHDLRQVLAEAPRPIEKVAPQLFDDRAAAIQRTGELVSLCAAIHDHGGAPLLPARYHLWARATEGAYTCLGDDPHVSLVRTETCRVCARPSFEVGSCKRCSAPYLIGSEQQAGPSTVLTAPRRDRGSHRFFVLLPLDGSVDGMPSADLIDEDDAVLEELDDDMPGHTAYRLCTDCGRLGTDGVTTCNGCGSTETRIVLKVEKVGVPKSCGLCGGRSNSGQVRRLESGAEASGSVLATTLYQSLPPSPDPTQAQLPGNGRKLLLFSDSRQDAAYFAPSLEGSYQQLVRRRLVHEAIRDVADLDEDPQLEDVIGRVKKLASKAGLFDWQDTSQYKQRMAATWVLAETVSVSASTSLEGLGLVAYGMRRPPQLQVPKPLLDLGLTDDEGWALVTELLRTVRMQGALSVPEEVDPGDEIFRPRLGPIYLRGEGPEAKLKIMSWLPGRGSNTRIDYLRRVLTELGSDTDATDLAKGIWRWLRKDQWATYLLETVTKPGLGELAQVNHALVTVRPVDELRPVHQCSRCRRLAPAAVRGVCTTMGCTGRLEPWAPDDEHADPHHYRRLARDLDLIPMTVREHTAQLANDAAASTQQDFIDARVNALSCSTTFELGVDVGDLQSVFLRNVPPLNSNYVQRAGRAGRRTDAAALVVTYAQRRSHDLNFFSDPTSMIAGEVRPPRIDLNNERIASRHASAIAIAAWFRHEVDQGANELKTVADLHDAPDGLDPADTRFLAWLADPPTHVTDAIAAAIPDHLHGLIGLDDGTWADRLAELVSKAGDQHRDDVAFFREEEAAASKEQNYSKAKLFQKTANTLNRRYLLQHLANRNMLPKYGFPVDTVDLRTDHIGSRAATELELQRDLRLAISDYAPGSELVARGLLWRSGGIRKLPGRELPVRYYVACGCGYYREELSEFALEECPSCGDARGGGTTVKQYVVPEFGFLAARTQERAPTVKPRRTYANRVSLVHHPDDEEPDELVLPSGAILEHRYVERGELAVINDGPQGRGYRICNWCGWGEPIQGRTQQNKQHTKPRTGESCRGPLDWRSLGHRFQTDVLLMQLQSSSAPRTAIVWHGLLYALLESAASQFTIARDDLDGTIHLGPSGPPTLVLFDDVPAGAGHVKRLRDDLPGILQAAYERTAECECGPETSCYRCLRGFRNQRMHDDLRRGAVAELLAQVLQPSRTPTSSDELRPVHTADLAAFDGRTVGIRVDGSEEVHTGQIWIEHDGARVVSVLLQSEEGVSELAPNEVTVVGVR